MVHWRYVAVALVVALSGCATPIAPNSNVGADGGSTSGPPPGIDYPVYDHHGKRWRPYYEWVEGKKAWTFYPLDLIGTGPENASWAPRLLLREERWQGRLTCQLNPYVKVDPVGLGVGAPPIDCGDNVAQWEVSMQDYNRTFPFHNKTSNQTLDFPLPGTAYARLLFNPHGNHGIGQELIWCHEADSWGPSREYERDWRCPRMTSYAGPNQSLAWYVSPTGYYGGVFKWGKWDQSYALRVNAYNETLLAKDWDFTLEFVECWVWCPPDYDPPARLVKDLLT